MKLGIQKRQWLLLFLVLSFPLLLNAMAIWQELGTVGVLRLLVGTYQPPNPNLPIASFADIVSEILFSLVLLGLLSWLVIFVANKSFFQKQWLVVRLLECSLVALFVAKVFETLTGFFMPFAWLPEFYDQIGLPISPFTLDWSHWFIFPATAILLFIAMFLHRDRNLESKKLATPLMPYEQTRG